MPAVSGDPTYIVAEDLRRLPTEHRKAVRPKLVKAGESVVRDARARAGWSDRIPGTVKMKVSFRFDREQVLIVAGGPSAPHARPFEGMSRDPFRHPVYGNREVWVPEPARPYLLPAGRAHRAEIDGLMRSVMAEAAAAIGF